MTALYVPPHAPRTTPGALALVLTLTFASVPIARADTASEADLQYSLGMELYKQRRYGESLTHFIASHRLVPNANVVFNIAQIYGLLRRDVDAFNWYETYLTFDSLDEEARERGRRAQAAVARRVAVIDVTTTPNGAELFIDRVDLGSVGVSPRRVGVSGGPHAVIARLPHHHEARVEVVATTGTATPASLALSMIVGTLVVESTPAGGTVRREEDDSVLGTTPLRVELPVGSVRLVVAAEGYVEQQRSVEIMEGREAHVALALKMDASRVAVLTVEGAPAGATVRLRGRELGTVPLTEPGLPPGTAELEITAPNHEPYRTDVLLEPNAATRVRVTLVDPTRGPSPHLKWVGYGGGGAILVAGAILGAISVDSKNHFYDDPSRAAYDRTHRLSVAADTLMITGLVTLAATLVIDLIVKRPYSHAAVELSR
jgi:outer membrane receptor for ferrienterochelin and colicins